MRSAIVRLLATLALCVQLAPRVPADVEVLSSYLDESESAPAAPSLGASFRSIQTPHNDQLFQLTEKRQAAQYCGRRLADALHIVCKGRYNAPLHKKSTLADSLPNEDTPYYWLLPPSPLEEEHIKFPFRPRSLAAALMPSSRLRRRTRGVYEECCLKGCSLKEMTSYCGGR